MDANDPLTMSCKARVGRVLNGKWRLDHLIGVGGMAAVYAATHRNGARAAIKLLHGELTLHSEAKERFLREAYIANKVQHPGTVKALDDDVTEQGEPYLVMELLQGEAVDGRARTMGGRLPVAEVLWIAERTLSVLELAHAAGVVHRDLKPENLFLTESGELKVLDFGIARLREANQTKKTQTGMMMGTPEFMSPEQAMARWNIVDGRTDLWAVGAIMFSLIAGRSVHEGSTVNEILIRAATQPASSLARVVPSAPLSLVKLVDRALAFDQKQRFPDAAMMRAHVRLEMGMEVALDAQGQPVPGASVDPTAAATRIGIAGGIAAQPAASAAPRKAQAQEEARTRAGLGATIKSGPERAAAPAPSPRPPAAGPGRAPAPSPQRVAPVPRTEPSAGAPGAAPTDRVTVAQDRRAQGGGAPAAAARPQGAVAAAAQKPKAPAERSGRRADAREIDLGTFTVPATNDEEKKAMQELFIAIDRALVARRQYGVEHSEAGRRMDRAFSLCASMLMQTDAGLLWNVTPYSFIAGKETLWEPATPLDRIPYQLFSDGVRMLGFLPGLTESEFLEFLRIATLDRAVEVAPEDDCVTLLWEAGFEHVVHQAIDSFAEGDQSSRAKFAREQAQVVALAHFDTSMQLEECWEQHPSKSGEYSAEAQKKRVLALLAHADAADREAKAQAGSLYDGRAPHAPTPGADAVRIDEQAVSMLAARLHAETDAISGRFITAAARAHTESARRGVGGMITTPVRAAVDGLVQRQPKTAIDLVLSLCRAVGELAEPSEAERLQGEVTGEIVSRKTLEKLLAAAISGGGNNADWTQGLSQILGRLDDTHVKVVLEAIPRVEDADLQSELVSYLARNGKGHEAEFGAMIANAPLELALALVRVLAELPTKAARDAITLATRSPHPVVRIEALGHIEGASSERLRSELRALLLDREPGVRLATLKAMQRYNIRAAGPFLVLQIREKGFDGLPVEERRQALETVATLAPKRAEAVCLALLSEGKLIGGESHDKTREFAAEVLGRLASSKEVIDALDAVCGSRWRSTEALRKACATAAEAVRERLAQGIVQSKEPRS
jgi:eukaryotic-like serine/threonine-protein kinase